MINYFTLGDRACWYQSAITWSLSAQTNDSYMPKKKKERNQLRIINKTVKLNKVYNL